MLDNLHNKRSWIDGLKVSPRHLKNKTHATRNGYDYPRPSFDFPNGPFGRHRFRVSIRLIKELRQRTERRKYRFMGICGEDGKVGCDSERCCIGRNSACLFLAC